MCKFSNPSSQKFAPVKNTLRLWVRSCLEDLENEALAPLAPNIRTTIIQEKDVNQLHHDAVSNMLVVSIPQFREADFLDLNFLGEDNLPQSEFRSSTFRLADVLKILPGQPRHSSAMFRKRSVLELSESEYLYRAKCSRSGLARLICRFFCSIQRHENVVKVYTTLGLFELHDKRLGMIVHYFPQSRAIQAHPFAGEDFVSVIRFAQGMFRLGDQAMRLAFDQDATVREPWQLAANQHATLDLFMMTPALDHPHCIRFASQDDISKLRNKRTVAQIVMNSFLRIAAEQTEEPFPGFGLLTTVITQSADGIFSTLTAVPVLSEAVLGACTIAYPEEMERKIKITRAMADYQEMEQDFIAESIGRPAAIRARLRDLTEQYEIRYVTVLTAIALLVSMNCSVVLSLSVESPQLWIDILSALDEEVYVA